MAGKKINPVQTNKLNPDAIVGPQFSLQNLRSTSDIHSLVSRFNCLPVNVRNKKAFNSLLMLSANGISIVAVKDIGGATRNKPMIKGLSVAPTEHMALTACIIGSQNRWPFHTSRT